jgi:hypothetical protein
MIRKSIYFLLLLSSLVALSPRPAAALSLNKVEQPSSVDFGSIHRAMKRMQELSHDNNGRLSRKERKAIEKELKLLQKSAVSNSRGAVTISVGSLLLIILILILVL